MAREDCEAQLDIHNKGSSEINLQPQSSQILVSLRPLRIQWPSG